MSNSPLVSYTKISPNQSGPRLYEVTRITPHCVVGQLDVETIGEWMAQPDAQASCNYCIGSDGRVGLIVDEADRSWCSSSRDNDNRAITIECASDLKSPYALKDVVYQRLIDLCYDICKRYKKTGLLWIPSKEEALSYQPKSNEMILTVHRWFANKDCPGAFIYEHLTELAQEVCIRLAGPTPSPVTPVIYNTVDELPDWAQPTIIKLINAGALQGNGGAPDEHGYPTGLSLSLDMVRTFVVLDRDGSIK